MTNEARIKAAGLADGLVKMAELLAAELSYDGDDGACDEALALLASAVEAQAHGVVVAVSASGDSAGRRERLHKSGLIHPVDTERVFPD